MCSACAETRVASGGNGEVIAECQNIEMSGGVLWRSLDFVSGEKTFPWTQRDILTHYEVELSLRLRVSEGWSSEENVLDRADVSLDR